MSLAISSIGVSLNVPGSSLGVAKHLASAFEVGLERDLAAYLGPSLDRGREVVRIREIRVRLLVTEADLSAQGVLELWMKAFAEKLFEKLALPSEPQTWGVYREESLAMARARFLRFLLRGDASASDWYFAEFQALRECARAEAVLRVLDSSDAAETVDALWGLGAWDAALAVLAPEQLDCAIQRFGGVGSGSASLDDLLGILGVAVALPGPSGWKVDGLRNALRLWAALRSRGELRFGAREVFEALVSARSFLATNSSNRRQLEADANRAGWIGIWDKTLERSRGSARWPDLRNAVSALFPGEQTQELFDAEVLGSNYAGLLLLVPLVERAGWSQLRRDPRFPDPFLEALLAAVACDLCGDLPEKLLADPAVFTFAGAKGPIAQPMFRRCLDQADWAALAAELDFPPWSGPEVAIHELSDRLATEFASRLRSLSTLNAAHVRRLFVRRQGRIQVSDSEVEVTLHAHAYNIVLHIAGTDTGAETSAWFGNRRLKIILEGL